MSFINTVTRCEIFARVVGITDVIRERIIGCLIARQYWNICNAISNKTDY